MINDRNREAERARRAAANLPGGAIVDPRLGLLTGDAATHVRQIREMEERRGPHRPRRVRARKADQQDVLALLDVDDEEAPWMQQPALDMSKSMAETAMSMGDGLAQR
jgi:hypothetical protein